MWDCATSKQDHTECCNRKWVTVLPRSFECLLFLFIADRFRNVVKECLPYCSHKTAPTNYLQHLFCLQSFNPIRDCFREHLEKNPNIFGDA